MQPASASIGHLISATVTNQRNHLNINAPLIEKILESQGTKGHSSNQPAGRYVLIKENLTEFKQRASAACT